MTANEIITILKKNGFTDTEISIFTSVIDKAKECIETNNTSILKSFIANKIEEELDNEI